MTVIPSLDILGGRVVRLTRGDFATAADYGEPDEVLDRLRVPAGARLHVVDLEGSRDGRPVATALVHDLGRRGLRIQCGGGARTEDDVARWLGAGAERVVVGTIAAEDPQLLATLVARFGAAAIVPAIDVCRGERASRPQQSGILPDCQMAAYQVKVAGWKREAAVSLENVMRRVEDLGLEEILVTDIDRDGVLAGPALDTYRSLARLSSLRVIASGGVTTLGDVIALARMRNVSGCVIGKALLDGRMTFEEAAERAAACDAIPPRVIPCLDVRNGRVVKGINFAGIRDAGDPVECARRYEEEGADEIVVLDISATDDGVATAMETVRRIADEIFIPLTIGGGVRSVGDFRGLLRAGADRVAINTAAVRRPELIAEAAAEFGTQAVILSCDAKRTTNGFEVMVRSGKESTGLDAVTWCRRAESLGAGEILLTSVDRDGTNAGFDIELLRAVTAAVRINVIASGGAGSPDHFREAIDSGGVNAVLAASLFHDRRLTIGDVKSYLASEGIAVR